MTLTKKKRSMLEGVEQDHLKMTDEPKSEPNLAKPYPVELYVNFLTCFTDYTREQAQNIVTGLVPSDNLSHDLMRLCIRLKKINEAQSRIDELAKGYTLLKPDDELWNLS